MLLLCTGLLASAAVYTHRLDRVPAYLTLDESHFSVHAASLAQSGRNLNGHLLPPLISLEDPEGEKFDLPWGTTYYLSFGMYLIAAVLKVLPISEAAVRLPSALLGGVVNVALIFMVALTLFRSRVAAAGAAMALALSPANVIISRQALDSVCQPAFVLGALWCLASYVRKPDPRIALACGFILGCGVYVYITSIIFMPFYLAVFWFISWRAGVLERRTILYSLAGFIAALLPMTIWLMAHPEVAYSLQIQYNRADPGSPTLMEVAAERGAAAAIANTINVYWSYFDPSFLFVEGGNARSLSTGRDGVFVLPVAVLALIGLYRLREHRTACLLIAIGLLASPLPAVIKGAPFQIQRASGLLIYISLLAGLGLASLVEGRRALVRAGAGVLTAIVVVMFALFYRGYHGEYRTASALSYDPTAFSEAVRLIMESDRERSATAVYLPTGFYDVSAKWRFYTLKHQRPALWQRTEYFSDVAALAAAPADSIAVVPQNQAAFTPPPSWTTVGVTTRLDGEPTAAVIRRAP